MDIEVVSTEEKFFKVDDGAARCLIAAFPEAFRRIEKPAPPVRKHVPSFSVFETMSGKLAAKYTCPSLSGELFFTGNPGQLETWRPCCCGQTVPVPADVLLDFTNRWRAPNAVFPGSPDEAYLKSRQKI